MHTHAINVDDRLFSFIGLIDYRCNAYLQLPFERENHTHIIAHLLPCNRIKDLSSISEGLRGFVGAPTTVRHNAGLEHEELCCDGSIPIVRPEVHHLANFTWR
jgi:hypothetical protein